MGFPMVTYISFGIQLDLEQVVNFILEHAEASVLNKEYYDGDTYGDLLKAYTNILNSGGDENEEVQLTDEGEMATEVLGEFSGDNFKINGRYYTFVNLPHDALERHKFTKEYCLTKTIHVNRPNDFGVIHKDFFNMTINDMQINFNEQTATADLAEVSSDVPQYMYIPGDCYCCT
jgi:hypothetical protein